VQAMAAEYDFIFSDGRYGFHSPWAPSFMLTHQVAFIPPKGLRETTWLTEHVNVAALRKFDAVLIPDYPCPSINLAGHLAHTRNLYRCSHRYVGIISSYRHLQVAKDIDYLFIISCYLLEHKDAFVHSLLEQRDPVNRFEIIVVENGSNDATPSLAQNFAREAQGRVRTLVLQSERGVSRARNTGLEHVSRKSNGSYSVMPTPISAASWATTPATGSDVAMAKACLHGCPTCPGSGVTCMWKITGGASNFFADGGHSPYWPPVSAVPSPG
jgi:hypothetical protein